VVSGWRRVRYRVRQFTDGVRPWLEPYEIAEARGRLSEAEFALFMRMEGRDRKHSLRVMRWIERTGRERGREPSEELLNAALLHDIGKGDLATWHRIAFVLLGRFPPLASRLEAPEGAGWQRALWRLRHHARLGAERLAAAGSSARVVELVARHTGEPGDDAELAWLIEADGES
jgi:putative nucleotidyltransferase with HDIG domain